MSSRALERLLSRATAPRRRVASAGGLTSGPPLSPAEIRAGVWDFRTPILVLALQPVVDPDQFAVILGDNFARLGANLLSCGISVGEPFWQSLPGDNSMLAAGLQTLGVASALSAIDTSVSAGTAAVGLASIFGWAVGSGARYVAGADRVIARWITIEGTLDSRGRVTTLDEVTRAEVEALDLTLRFRHPESGALLLPQAESVRARTREPNACAGARRFDKVIAAACTRMEPSSRQPPAPRSPGATTAPGLTPIPPEVRQPAPEPPSPWTGEGDPPPIPSGLDGGKAATGEQGFLARYRKPIGAGLALAAAAGLAVVLWPRNGQPAAPALPATRRPR